MSCKYKYKDNWYSKEEIKEILLKERGVNSKGELIKPIITNNPKQAEITKENTTSIESVKDKVVRNTNKYVLHQHDDKFVIYDIEEQDALNIFDNKEDALKEIKKLTGQEDLKEKEYTEQALINTKIAKLKEVAKKYPRSLITSRVVPINPNLVGSSEIQYSKKGGVKPGVQELFESNPELANAVYEALGFNNNLPFIESQYTLDDNFIINDELIVTKELQDMRINNWDGSINTELEKIRNELRRLPVGSKFNVSKYTNPINITLEEVISKINLSESNKLLLEKIRPLIKNTKIQYVDKFILKNAGAVYSDKYNTIRISKSEKNISLEEMIMHELLHAATFRKITYFETNSKGLSEKELKALNELEKIRVLLKEEGEKWFDKPRRVRDLNVLGGYTTDSIHEIISYAFTNKAFRDAIAEIPYKGTKSILDKLIELIANIFGAKQDTILSALLANAEVLLESNQITPQQKQQAQQAYSQYLEQNPNGSVEQFKSWVNEFNRNYQKLNSNVQIFSNNKEGNFDSSSLKNDDLALMLFNQALGLNLTSTNQLTWDNIKDNIFFEKEDGSLGVKNLAFVGGNLLSTKKPTLRDFLNQKGLFPEYKVFIGESVIYPNVFETLQTENEIIKKSVFENLFNLSGAFEQVKKELNNQSPETFIIETPQGKFTFPKRFAAGFFKIASTVEFLLKENQSSYIQDYLSNKRKKEDIIKDGKKIKPVITQTLTVNDTIVQNAISLIGNSIIENAIKNNTSVKIRVFSNAEFSEDGVAGWYLPASNTIYLHESMLRPQHLSEGLPLIAHELIHSVTEQSLQFDKNFQREIQSLLDRVKAQSKIKDFYGFKNTSEFLSEAFSSQEFRQLLKDTQFSSTENLSVWQKFVNAILKLFGKNAKYGEKTITTNAEQILNSIINQHSYKITYVNSTISDKINSNQNLSNFISQKSQERLNQIQQIFNENSELSKIGTVEQYASYLNTIFPDSKVKDIDNSLYNSILNQLEQENKIEKDCSGGKLKAKDGIRGKFTKGSQWEIYEIFEGKSHKQGGIEINIKNNQINFTNKNGSIKAKYGLVISKDS